MKHYVIVEISSANFKTKLSTIPRTLRRNWPFQPQHPTPTPPLLRRAPWRSGLRYHHPRPLLSRPDHISVQHHYLDLRISEPPGVLFLVCLLISFISPLLAAQLLFLSVPSQISVNLGGLELSCPVHTHAYCEVPWGNRGSICWSFSCQFLW